MTNHQDTSTEREKLKPCPFCGGAAKFNIINDDPEGPNHQGHYIECEGCGASTKLMFSCGEDCRPALAELWNRRAALASRDEAAHPMLRTLTREQINSIMTKHYPLSSLLREEVDAFEACVRDIEKALFTSPPPKSDEARDALTQAAIDVLAERQRQISAEGWTPEHDDEHSNGEMGEAAACYAASARLPAILKKRAAPAYWPWDATWWKPSSPRRDLIKAGALILAEIERLDRAALAAQQKGNK